MKFRKPEAVSLKPIFMRQIAKLVVLQMLRGYKWAISPMLPPACRFVPTCSEYAEEAVERYGAVRGGLMSVARLLRCHPFARGGYDPVVKAPNGRPAIAFSSEGPQGLKPVSFAKSNGTAKSRALPGVLDEANSVSDVMYHGAISSSVLR